MNIYKSFSVYVLTSFIERGLAFFLLPIFTYYLTPYDYGVLSLLTSLWVFTLPIVSLGTQGAISVAYFSETKENYPSYVSSSLLGPMIITVFLFIICLIGGRYFAGRLEISQIWLIIIPLFAFFSMVSTTLLIDYQVKQEVLKYGFFSFANSTVNIGLSLFLVISLGLNYQGRLIGQYISIFLFAFIGLIILKRRGVLTLKLSKKFCKDSLMFGLPLIPHVIGGLVINMSDRIFINQIVGKDILGIYNIGYTIASSVSILCSAFANAIVPYSYGLFTNNDDPSKRRVVKVYWLFMIILASVVIVLNLIVPYIFDWFIDKRYAEGVFYVKWISLAFFFQGCYLLFANIIFYTKKTKILFYWSFANIVINLCLNYVFVHRYGAMGAAYTICISYFIFFVSIAFFSRRLLPLPWFYFFKK